MIGTIKRGLSGIFLCSLIGITSGCVYEDGEEYIDSELEEASFELSDNARSRLKSKLRSCLTGPVEWENRCLESWLSTCHKLTTPKDCDDIIDEVENEPDR